MWLRNALNWLKTTFPGTYQYLADFFKGMNSKDEGHSLKKWLTVGLFWLIVHITEENTTKDNLEYVLAILVSALLTVAGIYSYQNFKTKRLEIETTKQTNNDTTNQSSEESQTS